MRRSRSSFALVLLSLAIASPALAHDYWVSPDTLTTAPGNKVALHLRVGTAGEIKEQPYKKKFTKRFEAIDSAGRAAIVSKDYHRPAGEVVARNPGVLAVAFESRHAYIELEAKKFHSYLEHEGLKSIIRERKRVGEADKLGTESYMRSAKALIRVGESDDGWNRKFGLQCEVTPRDNPYQAKQGTSLAFEVELAGRPLPGVTVELMSLSDLGVVDTAVADRHGVVRFKAPASGRYMVALTYMRRSKPSIRGDWESLWSTLTFER